MGRTGDANHTAVPGVLRAYQTADVSRLLWESGTGRPRSSSTVCGLNRPAHPADCGLTQPCATTGQDRKGSLRSPLCPVSGPRSFSQMMPS